MGSGSACAFFLSGGAGGRMRGTGRRDGERGLGRAWSGPAGTQVGRSVRKEAHPAGGRYAAAGLRRLARREAGPGKQR